MPINSERLWKANKAIEVIASHGRRFFHSDGDVKTGKPAAISHFELRQGRLWFIDKWTGKPIWIADRRGEWRGFTEGGTLRRLIEEIGDWIIGKREDFPIEHLGPWRKEVCGGDLWGYGEDMEMVRSQIREVLACEPHWE